MKGEAQLQSECVKWFRLQYPELKNLLFAIPNGGSRDIREAANLKRQGVLPGVPDLMLAKYGTAPYINKHLEFDYWDVAGGLFIEMKHNGNRQTPHQKAMAEELMGQGYAVAVCSTFEEFKDVIEKYLS